MTNSTTWAIEPAHTHIGFSVRHLGLTSTPGVFKRFTAEVRFDDQAIEASAIRFEVEVASIDTALALRDEHLRGGDWFDAEAHPKAVFASRVVRRGALEGQLTIDGDLTLRGVTLPLTLDARLTGRAANPWTQAPVVGFEATGIVRRSVYGMGAFPGALSDEVKLHVQTELSILNESNQ